MVERPTWRPDSWSVTGWNHRRPHTDVYVVLDCFSKTTQSSNENRGLLDHGHHLGVCMMLGLGYNKTPDGIWITSRAWLVHAPKQYWLDK